MTKVQFVRTAVEPNARKPWKVVANGGQLWSNRIDEYSR